MACAHCGGAYNGGRLSAAQGQPRVYAHSKPKERRHPEQYSRTIDAGCKVWTLDAEEIESGVKNLIVKQRSSKKFKADVKALILERDNFRENASEAVARAKQDVEQREIALRRLARMAAAAADGVEDDANDDALVEQLKSAKHSVKAAKSAVVAAEVFARSAENAWERLSDIIHETRNIAAAWMKIGPEERKILLDYWVLDILIVVQPVPGKRRANHKTAVVTLRTAPNAPLHFDLGGDQSPPPERTLRSSARTQSSDSTGSRARRASKASGEPMRASAQAACPRTSGSDSESAATSDGTSSGVPTLPSTTAELRFNPRSLARFIGDSLNASENSNGDMAKNSRARIRASLPATAGRAAKAGSDSGSENLRENGHSS
jgi:hypothetical protein